MNSSDHMTVEFEYSLENTSMIYHAEKIEGLLSYFEDMRKEAEKYGEIPYLSYVILKKQQVVFNTMPWPPEEFVKDYPKKGYSDVYVATNLLDGKELFRIRETVLDDEVTIIVGASLTMESQFEKQIKLDYYYAFVLILVIFGSLISLYLVWSANRKIRDINRVTKEIINSNDLSRRVPLNRRKDEFYQLSNNINGMLDSIETLFANMKNLSSSIAHDLRTPLTSIKTRVETLAAKEDIEELKIVINEIDRTVAIFNAILRISKIENGKQALHIVDCDFKEIIDDLIDMYEPYAENKNLKIESSINKQFYKADRDLIFQAIVNLVDNGIKYSKGDGVIRVETKEIGDKLEISVIDNGPGVPKEMQNSLCDIFFRVDASRHLPGNGLGLSLVGAVVSAHSGDISFENIPDGFKVKMVL